MPMNYTVPGVYIQELPSGSKPIQGVGTSMPAFIGFTFTRPEGNTGRPYFVASWGQFVEDFCTIRTRITDEKGREQEKITQNVFETGFYLPYSVYGYFRNGGQSCYILSIATLTDSQKNAAGATLRGLLKNAANADALEITAKSSDGSAQQITVEIGNATGENVPPDQFKATVRVPGQPDQTIDNLTMNKGRDVRNAVQVLQREVQGVRLTIKETDLAGDAIERRPANGTVTLDPQTTALASATEFEGNPTERTGIGGLEECSDVTMVICPDLMTGYKQNKLTLEDVAIVQNAMLAHCYKMKDRFAILDAPSDMKPADVKAWRLNGANYAKDTAKYGALYYPWIEIANPAARNGGPKTILVPPSGHIAGVYARVDGARGVHKAPANESVIDAIKLERTLIDSEQAELNPNGVNCIRAFPGRGILVWGARTLAPRDEAEWMYVNVRRLFNYIEKSIYEGTQWVVFEPNDMDLWERVKRSVTAFLTRVWRDGALFGNTPEEAFYVRCDAELNPAANRDLGILTVEIGIAPVKPAEFVVFQFKQMSGGGEVSE